MTEFGSDFYEFAYPRMGETVFNCLPTETTNYYAAGRLTIEALVGIAGIQRLFVPTYFCGETLNRWRRTIPGIVYYDFVPGDRINNAISDIKFKKGDAILIVNYFGLGFSDKLQNNTAIIIEDHSHAPTGDAAMTSEADWCIASLRKALPVPDGAVLWSPKGHKLPKQPISVDKTELIMTRRWNAMQIKGEYIAGGCEEDRLKISFRDTFKETEEEFASLKQSDMSKVSYEILNNLDVERWQDQRTVNWQILYHEIKKSDKYNILKPYSAFDTPFSLVLLFKKTASRDWVKQKMIEHKIYPAILWPIENPAFKSAKDFSDRMLSVHCDGRYTVPEIFNLSDRINEILSSLN